jgi:hypothetical protein
VDVVVHGGEHCLAFVEIPQFAADSLPIEQPSIALLDCLEARLPATEKMPEIYAHPVEPFLIFKWPVELTNRRSAGDKIDLGERECLPTEERAVEPAEDSVHIASLTADTCQNVPILN